MHFEEKRSPQTSKNWPSVNFRIDRRLDVDDPRVVVRVERRDEAPVRIDADRGRDGVAVAAYDDVQVLMDVEALALVLERGQADLAETRVKQGAVVRGPRRLRRHQARQS